MNLKQDSYNKVCIVSQERSWSAISKLIRMIASTLPIILNTAGQNGSEVRCLSILNLINNNFFIQLFKIKIKKVETEQDTGLIDENSPEFKNFVKYGLITYVIMAIIGLTWEQIFKRIKNSKVKPYSKCDFPLPVEELNNRLLTPY